MAGLVLTVTDCGVVNVGQLIKCYLAVKLEAVVPLLEIVSAVAIGRELLHLLMACRCPCAIEEPPGSAPGDELKPGIHETQPAAVFETRMKVSDLAQLRNNPALANELFITLQLLCRVIFR